MRHVAHPIGLAETPRGMLVSLPPRLGIAVSLRKSFRGVLAAAEPWTYLVPHKVARRLGEWIALVEHQAAADARRRAWMADDAEWTGATQPAPAPIAAEPAIVVLPKKSTGRPVIALLERMAAGEILVADVAGDGRAYRLSPSGRRIAAGIATRAIGEGLIVPSCDGLFGADTSQTWRSPTQEETDAAKDQRRKARAPGRSERGKDRAGTGARAVPSGPARARGPRAARAATADGGGRARRRRAGSVA